MLSPFKPPLIRIFVLRCQVDGHLKCPGQRGARVGRARRERPGVGPGDGSWIHLEDSPKYKPCIKQWKDIRKWMQDDVR